MVRLEYIGRVLLAYFIADIGSYSKLKIVSFFPIHRKKIPISYKINKNIKIFKVKGYLTVNIVFKWWQMSSQTVNHCKISIMYFSQIFNKTPLEFPVPRVWVMFPKYWLGIVCRWTAFFFSLSVFLCLPILTLAIHGNIVCACARLSWAMVTWWWYLKILLRVDG